MAAIICNEGLILTVIGIVGVIEGVRLNRISAAAEEAYGPGWYLLFLSIILIVCGLCYLATTFKKLGGEDEKAEVVSFWKGPAPLCILAMAFYTFLIPYIGYFLGTAAFLLAATRLFGERSWVTSILLAGISGAVFWGFFVYLAQIPMP